MAHCESKRAGNEMSEFQAGPGWWQASDERWCGWGTRPRLS